MKIYSDTLTQADLELAATECNSAHLGAHIGFETLEPLPYKPRVRRNGWEVLLYRIGSRRPFNSGLRGAAGEGAASWGDWGWFLSCLYEKDPEAKAGPYKSRGHFHASTQGAYRIARRPDVVTPRAYLMVIFRRWHTGKDGHGVIALFPHLGGGPGMVQSFEHAGQHSAADMASVIRRTKPATAQEYAALKAELESAPYGYQLAVRKRSPH